jgi:hypothetical protein
MANKRNSQSDVICAVFDVTGRFSKVGQRQLLAHPDASRCTIWHAGQAMLIRHNPLLSGDFQPLTWGGMWGSSRVPE